MWGDEQFRKSRQSSGELRSCISAKCSWCPTAVLDADAAALSPLAVADATGSRALRSSPGPACYRTARATSLLAVVRQIPAGGDNLMLLVRVLRNVSHCHEALLGEHCVETAAEMASGVPPANGRSENSYGARTTLGLVIANNMVRKVLPCGPAWVAGLREGDVLLAVDGKNVCGGLSADGCGGLSPSAEVIQTALSQTDAVGDKVHVRFRRNGLQFSTVIERASAQRFKRVIDWMEKQAEAATHATQHNDVVGVRHQKELLDGLIEILVEHKEYDCMRETSINQLIDLHRLHLEASQELIDRLETEAGVRWTQDTEIERLRWTKDAEIERLRRLYARGALCRRSRRCREKAWATWCAELPRARRANKAAKMWLNNVLARVWRTLQWAVVARKRIRALASRAVSRWNNRAIAGALDLWIDKIARLKRLRQLMAKTVLRWKNLVVGRCFSQLHDELLLTRKVRRAVHIWKWLQSIWMRRLLATALNTWSGQLLHQVQFRRVAARAATRVRYLRTRAAWRAWDEAVLWETTEPKCAKCKSQGNGQV